MRKYCLTAETLSGVRCQADLIMLRSRGGATTVDNLCLACAACNGYKYARTYAIDPDSGMDALVLTSNVSALPEVTGDAALLVPPRERGEKWSIPNSPPT